MPATNLSAETFQEYATNQGVNLRVDSAKGIIHGVKILGLESKNGRTYSEAAVAQALPLYEGARVNVDHVKPGETASYHNRLGRLQGVYVAPDGLYADFHFNPKHALAEQLCYDAEHSPGNLGFSHDIQAKTSRRDGKVIIESISRVDSVDLVANPATTQGLFEDEQAILVGDLELRKLSESSLSAMADCRSILFRPELTVQAKQTRLSEVLATWQAELGSASTTKQESFDMDLKELTVEQLREHRKDLVEVLTGTDVTSKLANELKTIKESLSSATAELSTLKAKEAELIRNTTITEELQAAKFNTADKVACSEAFMLQLKTAPDVDSRKRIIEDRLSILRLAQRSPITSAAPLGAINDGIAGGVGPGATFQETISRLRS
jgi:hypothetical protein